MRAGSVRGRASPGRCGAWRADLTVAGVAHRHTARTTGSRRRQVSNSAGPGVCLLGSAGGQPGRPGHLLMVTAGSRDDVAREPHGDRIPSQSLIIESYVF